MYRQGEYVQQHYEKALLWYLKSVEQFYVPAYNEIGLLYAQGQGVEMDYIIGYAWIFLAAEKGDRQAKLNLKNFDQILNKSQKEEGQKVARSILSQYEKNIKAIK